MSCTKAHLAKCKRWRERRKMVRLSKPLCSLCNNTRAVKKIYQDGEVVMDHIMSKCFKHIEVDRARKWEYPYHNGK